MKKAFALILAFTLLLTLSACGKKGAENEPIAAPTPTPEAAPAGGETAPEAALPETVSPDELWGELKGVWVHYDNENEQHSFMQFYVEDGEYIVYDGIIATSFGQTGRLERLDKAGEDLYVLTVHYPEVPATEMDDARAAFDDSITINTAAMYEKTIMLTSARFPEPAPFDLLGETLEEVAGNPALYS